jgi:hypothetical protein
MSRTLKPVLCIWTVAALGAGLSGVLTRYPVRVAQAIGAALTLTQILLYFASRSFREQALNWNLRSLTLFQSWRIIPGSLFLYYFYALGQLPFSFAVIGGYGDILVGLTAIPMSRLGTADRKHLVKILLFWQVLGLLDLLFVIRSAFVASLSDPNIMRPLTQMPLVLLPLMLVPLTLFVHFVSIAQLIRKMPTARP